ncbi:alpha/beta hydrolase [Leeuwenhoekiella sp. MAR_2009_132]|uniref:alpha/beta hydrolase n=1 Tax=Leeuwenhoekiella sp. MAR_2009_132 TaxID=1392489 RepID=UPI000490884F|nr:alpha/beta hydrolase-fold protein [Leeuwenhoekiella sp. MAR_2009_132]
MKKTLLLLLLFSSFLNAQVLYETVPSTNLSESRQVKIQLPRNYETIKDKNYPVIVVLDADYLFEPVAGNVDYYSYWEDMPQAIVVGVMQPNRMFDTQYDDGNFLPTEQGASFFNFIGQDLFPWLGKKYRLAPFNLIVGHDATAGFANYYLMKNPPLFNAYISLSPDLAPQMTERLTDILQKTENKIFYYQATGTEDIEALRESTQVLHIALQNIENTNLKYYFDDFENATHYTLAGKAIPSALEQIFSVYRPITKKEFQEDILTAESPFNYLTEKYEIIENLFGIKDKIRINDFIAIAAALEKKADWDGFENLGKLARKEYPETVLGAYYLGRSYEGNGDTKKAMRTYESALVLKSAGDVDKDILMARAQRIKDDFGY